MQYVTNSNFYPIPIVLGMSWQVLSFTTFWLSLTCFIIFLFFTTSNFIPISCCLRNELAGIELYFPGQSNDTFIRLPEDFEAELEGTQGRVVSYFLDQGAASHALPAALNEWVTPLVVIFNFLYNRLPSFH